MALAVAIAALVVSVASLGFTAYQWRHEGPFLAVELTRIEKLDSDGQLLLTAEVTSVGRIAAAVRHVGVTAMVIAPPDSTTDTSRHLALVKGELPARLEPSATMGAQFVVPYVEGQLRWYGFAMARAGGKFFRSKACWLDPPEPGHSYRILR